MLGGGGRGVSSPAGGGIGVGAARGRHAVPDLPAPDGQNLPGNGAAIVWQIECGRCGGRGTVADSGWQAWRQARDELEDRLAAAGPIEADLIRALLARHHLGAPPGPRRLACLDCSGAGVSVTAEGVALLDFLERHTPPS